MKGDRMTRVLDRIPEDEVSGSFPVDGEAGFGALATERGRLPLQAMDVRARIDGLLCQVTVTQTFVNAFPDPPAVPAASRISPPVRLPGSPSPVRRSRSAEVLPAGLPVTGLRSSLHAVEEESAGRVRCVTLQPGARLDRDFILRLRLGEGS